jgi:hypothetical protein
MKTTAITITLAAVCATLAVSETPAAACRKDGFECTDPSLARVVHGSDTQGRTWAIQSVPAGSALIVGYEPPQCTYTTEAVRRDPGTDPANTDPASTTATETLTWNDGTYVYTEVPVDSAVTNQALVDQIHQATDGITYPPTDDSGYGQSLTQGLLVAFTPLTDTYRRFRVGCQPPGTDTINYAPLYGGFVDVGPWDPVFGLQDRVTLMRDELQLVRPSFVAPAEVDEWGGLVVRYPAWLSVTRESWSTQTSPSVWHYGWNLQLIAIPETLNFSLDFTNNAKSRARHGNKDWLGIIGCIGTPTTRSLTIGTTQAPERPDDPALDYAEPGKVEACAWSPPASGSVTIQSTIAYNLTLIANGTTQSLPTYYYTSEPTTLRTGELIAVNTNHTTLDQ